MQAEGRIELLEKSVSEAQTSESQVSELQQWIFRVDDLLNDFIEHDTTFECLPHDFQVILLNVLWTKTLTNTQNEAHEIVLKTGGKKSLMGFILSQTISPITVCICK